MRNERPNKIDSSESISVRQIRAIWTLAHRAGLREGDLREWVESSIGKKSIRSLSRQEAVWIIEDLLLKRGGQSSVLGEATAGKGKSTSAQAVLIARLSGQMGWHEYRLLRLAQKMYGVHKLADLRVEQASGLIEALKAIRKRHAA